MVADGYQVRADQFDASPLARWLGLRVVELEQGRAVVEMDLRPEHLNWGGVAHGGIIMTLADHAFGCALNAGDRAYVAVQFNTHFLAAPRSGSRLRAEAQVWQAGRRMGAAQVRVTEVDGRLIATASGTTVSVGAPPSP